MAGEKSQNVQDVFLNHIRKNKMPVTIFLVNGVKLQGIVTWFDNFSVLLRRDAHSQLVYKHAISTVMPAGPVQLFEAPRKATKPDLSVTQSNGISNNGAAKSTGQVLVLTPQLRGAHDGRRSAEARLAEAVGLALAINLSVVKAEVVRLSRFTPATLIGSGAVATLGALIGSEAIELVFIDGALSPVQQRNLERAWKCKVIDRTGLILEIFGERARTREGQLQVELAALTYQRSRLVRSWTHLERQRGGFGFVGGPGESQLEMDRRLIGDRIVRIRHDLEDVKRTRGLHRHARRRVPYPVVALV